MVKLKEVYDNIESPLDDSELLKSIISAYAQSARTSLFVQRDLYDCLVKMSQSMDTTDINLEDRAEFLIGAYNEWISGILNLSESKLLELEKKGMDARALQKYLRQFPKVTSLEDIETLKNNPLFENEMNDWRLNDGWEHIKSQYISARQESRIPVKHRLYVDCQNQDLWKLAQLFKDKCEGLQIPFYFKLGASKDRDDKMVIYSDTDNLASYISAMQEIAQEHPEIIGRCGKPPALTGLIDGWLGIGDEPPEKANGEKQSYNTYRADILESAVEEFLVASIREHTGKEVEFQGKKVKFDDIFVGQASQTILKKLGKSSATSLAGYGLKNADLNDKRFERHIQKHLIRALQTEKNGGLMVGLDKLDEVRDVKETLARSNSECIFSIPTRSGKSIEIDTYDIDRIVKDAIPIMQQIDPDFLEKLKAHIMERCYQAGIDENFCFQQGSREAFEQLDNMQIPGDIVQEPAEPKQQIEQEQPPEVKAKQLDNREGHFIVSGEMTDLINPELLKSRIELPNGASISARQYIQEFVFPHVPSTGKFILRSTGKEVSAKQFIEEYILGEGQKKYTGDISRLLEENTVANNGTIIFNGEPIVATSIVDSINPALMQKDINLPNGASIPPSQYIQEFVVPYIPSNGKFILRNNGMEISARQFIEEAVIGVVQERYNGDVKALINEMTVANNGTLSLGEASKTPREQALSQDMESLPKLESLQINLNEDEIRMSDSMNNITDTILKSKVTASETRRLLDDMKLAFDVRALIANQELGKPLTEDEKKSVEKYREQINIAQTRYQQQSQKDANRGI